MNIEDVVWEVKLPGFFNKDEAWLAELSKLRGELFYDDGKRPAFLLSNGEYFDRDEFEVLSTHILAYHDNKLIGAVRLLSLKDSSYWCISSKISGRDQFNKIVQELFHNKNLMELNRLIVHKNYQEIRLGVYLCAAAFILADDLNYFPIANGNIHILSLFHLKHLGGILYPKYAGPYSSEYYNDHEIYFLYFDKRLYSEFFVRQMNKMRKMIPFEKVILEMKESIKSRETQKEFN